MTFKQVCYLLHLEKEKNKQLQAERDAMHKDLIVAEEYAMKLKLENDKLKEKNESLINARVATLKDLAVADEKCKRLQSEKKMLESRQLRTGDTILIYGNRYVVTDFYHSFITEGERLVAVKPFPTPTKKKRWRLW